MTKDRRLGKGLAALLGTPEGTTASPVGQVKGQPGPAPVTPTNPAASQPVSPQASAGVSTSSRAATEEPASHATGTSEEGDQARGTLVRISVQQIDENPFQPRREFSEPEIASLSESLKEHDMLQPILVRRIGDRFQLISGERRLRAARQAGWADIPAQIREADDRLVAELAIVENLQRKDLNPLEKALSFKRYLDEHGCKQDVLAKRLKLDRSTIANLMRLLELPETVQASLREGRITAGHARALLPLGDEGKQVEFATRIEAEGMSVRAVEAWVSETIAAEDQDELGVGSKGSLTSTPPRKSKSEHLGSLEQSLRLALGTKVEIVQSGKNRGRIQIHFANHDEFERLHDLLTIQSNGSTKAA